MAKSIQVVLYNLYIELALDKESKGISFSYSCLEQWIDPSILQVSRIMLLSVLFYLFNK
jgi:hypothetical protein